MDVAAGANGAAKAGGNFIIAQIDVRATAGTVGRGRLIADFMFAFAFETGNDPISLAIPDPFQLSMEREFFGCSSVVFEFQPRFRRGR